jgi:hypothetical protein
MHYLAWPALHPARYTKVPAEPRLVTQSALAGCCQGRRHRTARGTARGGKAAPLCRTAALRRDRLRPEPRQAAASHGAHGGLQQHAGRAHQRPQRPRRARRTPAPLPGARRRAPAPDAAAREPGGRLARPNLRPIRNPNPRGATLAARGRVGDQRLRQAARRAAPGDAAQAAAAHGARQLPARQHQRPALADGVQHLCARAAAQRENPMQRACPKACGPAPLGHQQRLWQAGGRPARSPSNARLDAPKARAASTRCPYTRPPGSEWTSSV